MITEGDYDVNYVLCDIKTRGGSVFEHAVLKLNGEYVDPTLEAQNSHREVDYFINKEFTTDEFIKIDG